MRRKPPQSKVFRAERLCDKAIVHPHMAGLEGRLRANINGPSLIRVPSWVERRLGEYYLYFAHHGGRFIRLAYADRIEGPWTVHRGGTLRMDQTPCHSHVASPDVHVDDDSREIRMYYHGVLDDRAGRPGQVTLAAVSHDGVNFRTCSPVLGPFYFRVFRHGGWHYAIAKLGNESGGVLRSRRWDEPFSHGRTILPHVRHTAPLVEGDTLRLFYSRGGDCPERILLTTIDISAPWGRWRTTAPELVLEPEMPWEGADEPLEPSSFGAARGPVRQLRDPGIFADEGKLYLLYSVAGEQGIAIARLVRA